MKPPRRCHWLRWITERIEGCGKSCTATPHRAMGWNGAPQRFCDPLRNGNQAILNFWVPQSFILATVRWSIPVSEALGHQCVNPVVEARGPILRHGDSEVSWTSLLLPDTTGAIWIAETGSLAEGGSPWDPHGEPPPSHRSHFVSGEQCWVDPPFFHCWLVWSLYKRYPTIYIYIGDIWLDYPILSYYMPWFFIVSTPIVGSLPVASCLRTSWRGLGATIARLRQGQRRVGLPEGGAGG